jgi:hypothetical protein
MRRDTLVDGFTWLVRALRWANWLCLFAGLLALAGTFVFAAPFTAQIARKYGAAIDAGEVVVFIRLLCVAGCVAVWPIERLFAALAAMLATIGAGDPFATANATRLRIVGWSMLALQVIDLAMGAAMWWAKRHGLEVLDWQPSLTGWLAVLIAFVLARVFTAGAAMRDDLAGTI